MIICDKCWGTKITNGINNISRECGNCQGKGYIIPLKVVQEIQPIEIKDNLVETVVITEKVIEPIVNPVIDIRRKPGRPKVIK
jgi:hypothetical protein